MQEAGCYLAPTFDRRYRRTSLRIQSRSFHQNSVPENTILIVDALVETCELVYDLGPEVDALAEQLARQHNAADLRCARR